MDDERESPSLRQKLRSSLCLSCCFRSPRHDEAFDYYGTPRSAKESLAPWTRSRAHEFPEIKEKCRNLISRMGKGRRHSGDFRYDPLSYALNFDDDNEDEFPLKNFSARLPPSPPTVSTPDGAAKPVAVSRRSLALVKNFRSSISQSLSEVPKISMDLAGAGVTCTDLQCALCFAIE